MSADRPTFAVHVTVPPRVSDLANALHLVLDAHPSEPTMAEGMAACCVLILTIIAGQMDAADAATMTDQSFGRFCATLFKETGMKTRPLGQVVNRPGSEKVN